MQMCREMNIEINMKYMCVSDRKGQNDRGEMIYEECGDHR